MDQDFAAAPALTRPFALTEVPPEGLEIDIRATPAECAALARLNDLPAVHSFEAALRARRWRGDGLEIEGEIRASLRQNCVATLEEFDCELVEPVEARFAPPPPDDAPRSRRRHEPPPAAEITLDEDAPDPLIGGSVDLGAVVSEFFTLALDPYPRKPGAEFVEPSPAQEDEAASPFAALSVLKPRGPSSGEDR
ncbi:YceD family protein [Methylocystis sp. 9N]|uniref:YceD family protein n=1 Tax=Methylocystis borbori TaxID=3118750 RepID=A0ABU7XDL7_9HYPH